MSSSQASFGRSFQPWNDSAANPFVEFRNVTKRYGMVTAVDDLSLSIYEREFFALLGPSGCGKTTLMRMLAGFEDVTEGSVFLEGEDLSNVPPYRRPVNMMFQSYALFPHMNVEKNIAFGLKQEGMPTGEINTRVEEMLSLVKMESFAKRKPDQLSGGQRQRVALARSLAKQPKLLLLDEPLGALDRKLREETQFELIDLQERLGITFMIVTHDQEEAMTVADRIAVMDNGKIVQIDPPASMYEHPNSRYVANFLGDINLVKARVGKTTKGQINLQSEDGANFKVMSDEAVSKDQIVWLATRPEKLEISKTKPRSKTNVIQGVVWDIAYLGDLTIFKVKIADEHFVKVSVLNKTVSEHRAINWEDEVWLSFLPDSALVLTN